MKDYIEQNILPEYEKNGPSNDLAHAQRSIERSMKFAATVPKSPKNAAIIMYFARNFIDLVGRFLLAIILSLSVFIVVSPQSLNVNAAKLYVLLVFP